MFKLDLEKAEELEIKLPTFSGSWRKQENSKKIYFCFIDYTKAFHCVDHNKLWKILKGMGLPDHLTCLPRNLYTCQEATGGTGHGKQTGSNWEGVCQAVYWHAAYLTYMQSTSCEMPGWMKHKLESRLPGEISITSDMQMTPPSRKKAKRN